MRKSRLQSDPAKLRAWRERSKGLNKVSAKRKSRVGKLGIVRLVGEDMEALRDAAYVRAKGFCEMALAGCRGYTPCGSGELAHKRTKRNHGDTLDNVLWACPSCHQKSHNCGGKPCPKKPVL